MKTRKTKNNLKQLQPYLIASTIQLKNIAGGYYREWKQEEGVWE